MHSIFYKKGVTLWCQKIKKHKNYENIGMYQSCA